MVTFYTFGCKLNQLETEAIAASFRDAGFIILPWFLPELKEKRQINSSVIPALCIINTCTVTSKAEQKARRIIRLCLRYGCIVLVTGCYAQLEKEELAALGDNLFILPGQLKDKLLDLPGCLSETGIEKNQLSMEISRWCCNITTTPSNSNKPVKPAYPNDAFRFNPQNFLYHSRAFLKIQDGCDRSCAYCRVPLARGKKISLSSKEVLCRLQALEKNGMAEAVLSGVNICQYQDPDNSSITLPVLLQYVLDNTNIISLRLSSIEPEFLTPGDSDFFTVLAHPRIRNHFHISVQSGSNAILAAMGRPYNAKEILFAAEKLRTIRDDPFLACDIICGFPGETDDEFLKTFTLCNNIDFAWIHAFPYSKRPGTPAASIRKGLVNQRTAGERVQKLVELARQGKNAYILRWQGKTVKAVAENVSTQAVSENNNVPFFPAITDNYIKIAVVLNKMDKKPVPGAAFSCMIRNAVAGQTVPDGFDAWAELVIA